jgi:hypothetical protein
MVKTTFIGQLQCKNPWPDRLNYGKSFLEEKSADFSAGKNLPSLKGVL